MSNVRMSLTEFMETDFLNNQEIRTLPSVQESFNYNHGLPRGPPQPGMNIIVPGQSAHPFPVSPVMCGPPLHDSLRPPPLPLMPPPGPLAHPRIPHSLTPHHPTILSHRPLPHHIPNLPLPPSHSYGIRGQIEHHRHPLPHHVPQMMQTSILHPLPHGPIAGQTRHAPPPMPQTQQVPPPLPRTQAALQPPLPPREFQMQPPLPPFPPLPPEFKEYIKPPPPKCPPPSPSSTSKSSGSTLIERLVNTSTPEKMSKSSKEKLLRSSKTLTKKIDTLNEDPKPIPSIITPRLSSKPATTQSNSFNSRLSCSTVPPTTTVVITKDLTPPPPPLPTSVAPSTLNRSDEAFGMVEDAYDPEDATFSPTSSYDSPPEDEDKEESQITKYVKCPGKTLNIESSPRSQKNQERLLKDKKKRVSFSNDVSFAKKGNKSQTVSPSRPDLDSRLKTIFGGGSDEEKSPKKAKKSSNSSQAKKDKGDETRPLSPTPSPYLSRNLYLYWHIETQKARREIKANYVDCTHTRTNSDNIMPKLNGQIISTPLSRQGIPPLPKNLPTVPPPNYKCSLIESFSLKEGNYKLEMLKNMKRVHPYKVIETKVTCFKNAMDTELELTSAVPSDSGEETSSLTSQATDMNTDQEETVRLVLAKILEDLKCIIRKEVTKDLIDPKINECIENNDKKT